LWLSLLLILSNAISATNVSKQRDISIGLVKKLNQDVNRLVCAGKINWLTSHFARQARIRYVLIATRLTKKHRAYSGISRLPGYNYRQFKGGVKAFHSVLTESVKKYQPGHCKIKIHNLGVAKKNGRYFVVRKAEYTFKKYHKNQKATIAATEIVILEKVKNQLKIVDLNIHWFLVSKKK